MKPNNTDERNEAIATPVQHNEEYGFICDANGLPILWMLSQRPSHLKVKHEILRQAADAINHAALADHTNERDDVCEWLNKEERELLFHIVSSAESITFENGNKFTQDADFGWRYHGPDYAEDSQGIDLLEKLSRQPTCWTL